MELARSRKCIGVICGHIHQPAISVIKGIRYLNSGDWVESLTALTEDYNGNWNLAYYAQNAVTAVAPADDEDPETDADFAEEASLQSLIGHLATTAVPEEVDLWE